MAIGKTPFGGRSGRCDPRADGPSRSGKAPHPLRAPLPGRSGERVSNPLFPRYLQSAYNDCVRHILPTIGIPALNIRAALVEASKYQRDPSSPRRAATALYKAGVVVQPSFCSLGVIEWDYLDRRRIVNQATRGARNKTRPAMQTGWELSFTLEVLIPEYIDESMLREAVDLAGRFIGVGSFRPVFGRFSVVGWKRD